MSPEKVSKRQERRERMQQQKQRQRLLTIGAITLVAAILVFLVVWQPLSTVGEIITVTPAALPNADGLSLGDASASVTIDVFEDFQCPACQRFTQNTEPLVIQNLVATAENYAGSLYLACIRELDIEHHNSFFSLAEHTGRIWWHRMLALFGPFGSFGVDKWSHKRAQIRVLWLGRGHLPFQLDPFPSVFVQFLDFARF